MSRERRNAKKYEKRDGKTKEDEDKAPEPKKRLRGRRGQDAEPVEAPKSKRGKK